MAEKVRGSNLGLHWKTLSVNPAVKSSFFKSEDDRAAIKEGRAPPFICRSKDSGSLALTAPTSSLSLLCLDPCLI